MRSGAERLGDTGGRLRQAIWRWHFYAGLCVLPVLLLLAVTGALYLFKHEIEGVLYAPAIRVAPGGAHAPVAAQRAAVLAALPGAEPRRIALPADPARAAEWTVALPAGGQRTVFLDPYRAVVQGDLDPATRLMTVVSRLHGGLMAGRLGELVTELAACWSLVLVATGLYLWWPRRVAGWGGVLWPRLRAGKRTRLRDLHAVPAAWASVALVFLVLSGLPWAKFSGDVLASFGTVAPVFGASSPHFRGAVVPESGRATAAVADDPHAEHAADESLPWAVRHAPAPVSVPAGGRASLEQIFATIAASGIPTAPLTIGLPRTPTGVVKVSHLPDAVAASRTLYLDQYSSAVIGEVNWADYSPLGRAVEFGVSVHMGRQYRLANQLAGLAACLLIVLAAGAALVLWWRRRPAGWGLGAPPAPAGFRPGVGVLAIVAGFALVFPLVGASLLVVLALEALWAALQNATRTEPKTSRGTPG